MEDMSVALEASRPERSINETHESSSKRPLKDCEALTSFSILTPFTLFLYSLTHQGLALFP